MKRLLSLLLVTSLVVVALSGCNSAGLENEAYVVEYDRIMLELETTLDTYVYSNLRGYYVDEGFNSVYAHQNQVAYMEHLTGVLDDVLYDLDVLGHKTKDPIIQKYQSKVEYALKDMRGKCNNLMQVEAMSTILPHKNTLYREVYRFMVDMNNEMLKFVENEILLDAYLAEFRQDDDSAKALRILKEKNRMRYLYTYLMTASFIAPTADYTGLHVHPNYPWVLMHAKTYHVYELSFAVLLGFRDFYVDYLTLLEEWMGDDQTDEMGIFFAEITQTVNAYERYYNIRKTYPGDFYTSEDFKAYQVYSGNTRDGKYYDFEEGYPDLIESGEVYMQIREFLYNTDLQNIMYDNVIVK